MKCDQNGTASPGSRVAPALQLSHNKFPNKHTAETRSDINLPPKLISTTVHRTELSPFNMAHPDTVTGITNAFAQATLGDGAVPTEILLPNNIRPRAVITSLTTRFEVVWYKAQRNIWLRYTAKDKAEAVYQALNGKMLHGVRVRCHLKEAFSNTQYPCCVQLQGIPANIGLSDIRPYLPGGEAPDETDYGRFNYPANVNALGPICAKVAARSNEPVRETKAIGTKNGTKQKAEIIHFAEAANLAAHARALDGNTIPELGNGKIFVVERLHVYVAIQSGLYKRRSKAFKGIAERAWNSHRIEVKIFDGELRYVQTTFLISILGNGRAAVQQVKAEIDKCVGEDAVKGLQRRADKSVSKRHIYLNTVKEFKQANEEGGLARLKKFYGDDKVSYNEEHDPPMITITTPDGKLNKAKPLLFASEPAEDSEVGECAICTEENVKLIAAPGCGHSSCESCLNDYCITDTSAHLPLKCFAHLNCEAVFPIRWLEENLSPVAYHSLFENIVAAQCQQDVHKFVSCAGPDCDQHLAISKRANKVICPACLTVNCTTCKTQYHFNETCEQSARRRDADNEGLNQYLEMVGGKRCPRCDSPGVRTEGCFHIECPGCQVHYCWLCLAWSNNMGDVYAHMEDEHGGAFGGEVQQRGRLVFLQPAHREMWENAMRLMQEREHLQALVNEQRAAMGGLPPGLHE